MTNTYIAKTLEEALNIKNETDAIIFAGGTDLMVSHFIGSETVIKFPKPTLHISNIESLKQIEVKDDSIVIGSLATFSDIIKSGLVPECLVSSAKTIAGPPIRNIATIGGNISNASPSADSLASLYCMNAKLVLKSKNDERIIPIKEFITGVGKTSIKKEEILTHIIIPKEEYLNVLYRKVGTRKANALSKLAICALVLKENDKYRFRVSFSTLGITTVRDESIEEKYACTDMNEWKKNIEQIKEDYNNIIKPRDSARSTALYRRRCALNLLDYFFNSVI